ncbi:cytochrome P450 [Mycobacterium sp. KBS0706]|uniref:cytochrome P450 n=1 Tax=Mycobacterium sp. KBS0706 TaxID=2578109 RepID=UPI00110F6F5F|nr:cytochrome P450 [Mycobacterium sp. KBS0706]TSD88813.1 cytochrome P450 [Mycobacterium sp. KBS0706]
MQPTDPVAAVTHPDPYPYYAGLLQRPFHRDDALGLWVAAGAEAAMAVLASPACRVRPPSEPVPRPLLGGAVGELFGRLVRMTDGDAQARAKRAVAAALDGPAETVAAEARRWSAALAPDGAGLDAYLFALQMHVVGALLGFARDRLPEIAERMRDIVTAIAPGATPEAIGRGHEAAAGMVAVTEALIGSAEDGLAGRLRDAAEREGGVDAAAVTANAVGFLFQTHDANAGLLGNAVVGLGARPELRRQVAADRTLLPGLVQEVLRCDPPAQNTRRFVAEDTEIAGQALRAGDAILVVIAAANRDPALNPDPDRFDPDRTDRRLLTFGHGRHACPGDRIALAIAAAGLDALLDRIPDAAWPERPLGYRPSPVRIPRFS